MQRKRVKVSDPSSGSASNRVTAIRASDSSRERSNESQNRRFRRARSAHRRLTRSVTSFCNTLADLGRSITDLHYSQGIKPEDGHIGQLSSWTVEARDRTTASLPRASMSLTFTEVKVQNLVQQLRGNDTCLSRESRSE